MAWPGLVRSPEERSVRRELQTSFPNSSFANFYWCISIKIEIDEDVLRWLSILLLMALIVTTCVVGYGRPLWVYPNEPSNPWPYAYNVIQDRIIKSGEFLVKTPQFGAMHRSDHAWFVIHHLTFVEMRLLTDLPFETIERALSLILSIIFFLGFYVFTRKAFGTGLGLVCSIFFLFVPRTHNYLVTVNGEFLGWLILFPALALFMQYTKNRDRKDLALSAFFGAFLPITNLAVFVQYVLVTWSYLLAEFVSNRKLIKTIKVAILIVLPVFVVSLPVLAVTGDIHPGSSSTIGSLFSSKTAEETRFENIYYDSYCDYWKVFATEYPILVELKYISVDYLFIAFVLALYLPLGLVGIFVSIRNYNKPVLLFPLFWLFSLAALETFLLSPIFGSTLNAFGIRLLLYFGWALAILASLGLYELMKITKEKLCAGARADTSLCISRKTETIPFGTIVFLLTILVYSGITISAQSAGYANSYPELYSKEYTDALDWIRLNTPTDAIIISNDWTGGIFWLKSQRVSLVEGGKGSAAYLTYKEIVTKLRDAREVFITGNVSKTIFLMNKYSSRYVVIWNRPSGYYACAPEEVNIAKFDTSPKFEKVFDEEHTYDAPFLSSFRSSYLAYAKIYYLADNSASFTEIVGFGGRQAGYTNGTYVLSYRVAGLTPSFIQDRYKEAKLHVYMKRLGNPQPGNYNIAINNHNLTINTIDVQEDWKWKSFQIPTTWISSSMNITFPATASWDANNQILIGTTEPAVTEFTYYSFDGKTWTKWQNVNLCVFLELTYD